MFMLLTYDIDQSDGGKRLHKVAKICEGYGLRVQNSVFELQITTSDLILLKKKLEDIIDKKTDSIRIYKIAKTNYSNIIVIGKSKGLEITKENSFIL